MAELTHLVQGFLLERRTRGLSPATVHWYGKRLRAFLEWCQAQGLKGAADVGREQVTAFLSHLHDRTRRLDAVEEMLAREGVLGKRISGFTVHGYLRTLKAFFSWAQEEGYKASPVDRMALERGHVRERWARKVQAR